MTPLILIPARLASTRLPGKPLADIADKPMIVRVCEQAVAADIGPVCVAAAEEEIAAAVEAAGFAAVLTDPDLPSGSDRVHAALGKIDPTGQHDTVINLQGDMPTLEPDLLRAVLRPLAADPACDIATLAAILTDSEDAADPNIVKAVLGTPQNAIARALYFSRAPVPTGAAARYHHIGVYAYRRDALNAFIAAPPTALERSERLEQLRALEIGLRIDCALVDGPAPNGVDTPEDLEAARALYKRAR